MTDQVYKLGNKRIKVSNMEKILYPEGKITKGDVINYYIDISEVMLRHLSGRLLSMLRAPDGLKGESFYQKDMPDYFPNWINHKKIKKDGKKDVTYVICNNLPSLLYLASQAVLTFHTWLSKKNKVSSPDKIVFDLDPPKGDGFEKVRETAFKLKSFFDAFSVKTFVMTTGSKGLHVVIPLKSVHGYKRVKSAAKSISENLSREFPQDLTTEHRKAKRRGRLFLDYLRNEKGQTSVCPYSLRILPRAPLAAPLEWKELKNSNIDAQSYRIENIFERLGQKGDPWKDFHNYQVDLETIEKNI